MYQEEQVVIFMRVEKSIKDQYQREYYKRFYPAAGCDSPLFDGWNA